MCTTILNCKRQCYRAAKHVKGKMRADRRMQNLAAGWGAAATSAPLAAIQLTSRRLSSMVKGKLLDADWSLCPDTRAESEVWLVLLNSGTFGTDQHRMSDQL